MKISTIQPPFWTKSTNSNVHIRKTVCLNVRVALAGIKPGATVWRGECLTYYPPIPTISVASSFGHKQVIRPHSSKSLSGQCLAVCVLVLIPVQNEGRPLLFVLRAVWIEERVSEIVGVFVVVVWAATL